LLLLGELERREAWRSWGCRSMAHWLSWKCGVGLHTAREQVRVAIALAHLPQTTAALARGELSFSKVRALTRIGDLDEPQERQLLDYARIATAAQLEHTVRAYRGVVRNVDRRNGRTQLDEQRSSVRYNDDGTVTIITTLAADAAVVVLEAIEQAQRQVPKRDDGADEQTSWADAVELLGQRFLQPDAHAQPAIELVIHRDEHGNGVDRNHGVALSIDAVRRLSCDAWIRHVAGDADDCGRRTRKISRRLRRQLVRRDGDRCRFSGCTNRHYLQGHHIAHWEDGGPTDLDNLVLLCSYHHKLVHEGGWTIDGNPNHQLTFVSPDGHRVEEAPTAVPPTDWRTVQRHYRTINGDAIAIAHGERQDLDLAITALCCLVPPDRN
jgi:hypothetical protein